MFIFTSDRFINISQIFSIQIGISDIGYSVNAYLTNGDKAVISACDRKEDAEDVIREIFNRLSSSKGLVVNLHRL